MRSGPARGGSTRASSQWSKGREAINQRFVLAMSRRQPRNSSRLQGSSIRSVSWARWQKSGVSSCMEEHGLSGNPRPKRRCAALLSLLRVLHNLFQDKHHGRGRHVAVSRENLARIRERVRRQAEPFFYCIENGAASRMYRPQVDRERILSTSYAATHFLHSAT